MMDTSNPAAAPTLSNDSGRPTLNVGMTLREAREALGMSVHDVAERIKFAPRQVEALEANDYVHLPQATFLRGFVRSYARVLQLDEVALLAALPSEPAQHLAARAQAVNVAFPTMKSLRGANMLWLAGTLGVALLLGLFLLLSNSEPTVKVSEVVVEPVILPSEGDAASAAAVAGVQPDDAAVVVPAESKKPEAPRTQSESKKPPETSKMPEPRKAPEANKAPESKKISEIKKAPEPVKAVPPVLNPVPKVEGASAPAAASPSVPLEVLKRRPLHFVFNESSWTEVLDSRGVVLLSRTNPRGTEKWVGGPRHEPYDISIAHPANVKLYFRGKEIDLSAYSGMDVVHLKLE
jgi:cytoskeleton protein RodZ